MKDKTRSIPSWYKWLIAALCFLTIMAALGFIGGLKGAYLKTVSEVLNVSRAVYSVNEIIRYVTTAVVNLFFGTLIVKVRVKRMMLMGVFSLILCTVCSATAQNIWGIYLGSFFQGLGLSWCSTTMVGYIVGKWFIKGRGTVTGLILASSGLGTSIATKLLRPVIVNERYLFGHTGWRTSYFAAAVLLTLIFVLLAIFLREPPERLGGEAPGRKRRGRQWTGMEWKDILRKPYFYVTLVCVFFAGLALQSASGIAVAHMEDVGLDSDYITNIISVYALILLGAKLLAGFAYDRIGLRATTLICTLSGSAAIFFLAIVTAATSGRAIFYELLMPFGLPMETVMLPLMASDMFGEKYFAKVMGVIVSVNTAGYAVGSLLSNLVFDWFGSYKNVLLFYAAVLFAVAVVYQICLIPAVRDRRRILEIEGRAGAEGENV